MNQETMALPVETTKRRGRPPKNKTPEAMAETPVAKIDANAEDTHKLAVRDKAIAQLKAHASE